MDFAFRRQSNDELFVLGPPEKIADVMGYYIVHKKES